MHRHFCCCTQQGNSLRRGQPANPGDWIISIGLGVRAALSVAALRGNMNRLICSVLEATSLAVGRSAGCWARQAVTRAHSSRGQLRGCGRRYPNATCSQEHFSVYECVYMRYARTFELSIPGTLGHELPSINIEMNKTNRFPVVHQQHGLPYTMQASRR